MASWFLQATIDYVSAPIRRRRPGSARRACNGDAAAQARFCCVCRSAFCLSAFSGTVDMVNVDKRDTAARKGRSKPSTTSPNERATYLRRVLESGGCMRGRSMGRQAQTDTRQRVEAGATETTYGFGLSVTVIHVFTPATLPGVQMSTEALGMLMGMGALSAILITVVVLFRNGGEWSMKFNGPSGRPRKDGRPGSASAGAPGVEADE
jgi:hypothetical protein